MKVVIRQSLRFGAVGLVNTAIGLTAIYAIIFYFNANPALANAIGYTIGLVVSFALNRFWTFGDTQSIKKVLPRYLMVATMCYLLNLSVVLLGTHHFGVGPYLVQLFGIGVYTVTMFLGCRWFVFRAQTYSDLSLEPYLRGYEHLTHPKYRADIDGLRAIAVLSVVGFHAFPFWVKGGFIGVDIFFVISGFLISTIIFDNLERNSFSFVEFYSRRIKRIFPALLLVLIASFAFGWFALLADEYKQLGKHLAAGAGFVSNFVFWNESGYFDNAAETKPLLHLWTLGIEEQFYIIWPLLLWAAWKRKFHLLTVTIVIAVVSFVLNVKGIRTDIVATFYSPQTRFWELLTGSILAYTKLYKQNILAKYKQKLDMWLGAVIYAHTPEANGNTLRNVHSFSGAALIGSGVLIITKERHFPGTWALLPTLGAALIISAGGQAWLNRKILSNRVLVWFGLISFPLYLWHWPLLSFARIVESETPTCEIRIAAFFVSILLAWLTYILVEKPIRFGKHTHAKTIALLVLMVVVGYVGYNTYKRDGFGFRFPKIIQELTQYKYDYKNNYREGSCFLTPEQDYTAFNSCETPTEKDKKTILLWGDSNAAHLYPGYKSIFSEKFNIVQRTASICPPILDIEINGRPHCKKINDYIFELIKNEKPNKVVLAANWTLYDWKKVEGTINTLRKTGITDIDLIGPVPQWIDTLPKQLYLYFKSDTFHKLPQRMQFGLNQNFIQLEPLLSNFSNHLGVNYISPFKILCDEIGCITRLGETGDTLVSWDSAHLTNVGSIFLVSKFPK